MASISNTFCLDIVSTVMCVRITISRLDSKFVKVPHCLNHKCMWVWWKLSMQGSTWKNMEGRSIILYLSFSKLYWTRNLCANIVYRRNYNHIVFQTWIHMGHWSDCVVLHSWMHKTHQMLCWHMQLGLVYLCEVTHTGRKDSHPILHCVSNLKTLEASK